MDDIMKKLQEPMPYKWRVQSVSKFKAIATCVAYIDARDVAERLDEVFGGKWQTEYVMVGNLLFCRIGAKIGDEWVWRSDTGTESNMEAEKGHASDAFKRAAVKWGIGRFLYDLKIRYVNTNEKKTGANRPYPINSDMQRIYDLTKYFNDLDKTGKKVKFKEPEKMPVTDEIFQKMCDAVKAGKVKAVRNRLSAYKMTKKQETELNKLIEGATNE